MRKEVGGGGKEEQDVVIEEKDIIFLLFREKDIIDISCFSLFSCNKGNVRQNVSLAISDLLWYNKDEKWPEM